MSLIKFTVAENNLDVVERATKEQIDRALEAIGLQAQEYAAARAPVDTGNLKNSMTHQLGDKCVYVGTNVFYATYQEFGTRRGIVGKHFLRDAVTKHTEEYKNIAETYLKG